MHVELYHKCFNKSPTEKWTFHEIQDRENTFRLNNSIYSQVVRELVRKLFSRLNILLKWGYFVKRTWPMRVLKKAHESFWRASLTKNFDHFYSIKLSLSSEKCITKIATFIKVSSNFVFISNFRTSSSELISRQRLCRKEHHHFDENWLFAN